MCDTSHIYISDIKERSLLSTPCIQSHSGFPQLAVITQAREPPGNELTCMHPPLFSGNVNTTLSRGCSDIGLDHGTKTLQYQPEGIAGTANIPRREGRTRSFTTLNIQLSVGALTVYTCFSAKTSTRVKLTSPCPVSRESYIVRRNAEVQPPEHTHDGYVHTYLFRCKTFKTSTRAAWLPELMTTSREVCRYTQVQFNRCNKSAKERMV